MGSYSTVQSHVKRRREEMAKERVTRGIPRAASGSNGPRASAKVDFGEADFRVRGTVVRGKYLTVSFPH